MQQTLSTGSKLPLGLGLTQTPQRGELITLKSVKHGCLICRFRPRARSRCNGQKDPNLYLFSPETFCSEFQAQGLRPCSSCTRQFAASVALEGHTDWIRTLSFSQPLPSSSDVLLASGGQDNYIRLWRLKALPEGASKPQLDDLDLLDENSDEVAIRAKFFTPKNSS